MARKKIALIGAGMARVQHASYQHAVSPNGFQKGATPAGCDRRARHCRRCRRSPCSRRPMSRR